MGERRTFDTNLVMSGETEAFSGCGCAFAHCSWWATVTLGEERRGVSGLACLLSTCWY